MRIHGVAPGAGSFGAKHRRTSRRELMGGDTHGFAA